MDTSIFIYRTNLLTTVKRNQEFTVHKNSRQTIQVARLLNHYVISFEILIINTNTMTLAYK